LTLYEENTKIPYGAELLEITPLLESNIDNCQEKIRELDVWVRGEMYRQGMKDTIASYQELVQNATKSLNLSSNLYRGERLNRLHAYFKVVNNKKK
tara:strand:- start:645 stop:932 length:288 start_codon:yes stop_codon:yes gene_type:complete